MCVCVCVWREREREGRRGKERGRGWRLEIVKALVKVGYYKLKKKVIPEEGGDRDGDYYKLNNSHSLQKWTHTHTRRERLVVKALVKIRYYELKNNSMLGKVVLKVSH